MHLRQTQLDRRWGLNERRSAAAAAWPAGGTVAARACWPLGRGCRSLRRNSGRVGHEHGGGAGAGAGSTEGTRNHRSSADAGLLTIWLRGVEELERRALKVLAVRAERIVTAGQYQEHDASEASQSRQESSAQHHGNTSIVATPRQGGESHHAADHDKLAHRYPDSER